MRKLVNKLPIPIVGLMCSLRGYRQPRSCHTEMCIGTFLGRLSAIILLFVLIKIILQPKDVVKSLDNPVVASVFPTLSMGIMILATYIKPFTPSLAVFIWFIGSSLHIGLILYFTKLHV